MATYFSYNLVLNVNSTAGSYSYTNTTGKHLLVTVNMRASLTVGFNTVHNGTATTSGGTGGVSRTYYAYSNENDSGTSKPIGGSTMILLTPGQTLALQHTTLVDVGNAYITQLTGFSITN